MEMVRGFIASGTSRTSAIVSRPSARSADSTRTKSASSNLRSKLRLAMPTWRNAALSCRAVLLALHLQHVLLRGDRDLVARETGHGQRDPVAIVGDALEVEGRIIVLRRLASRSLEHVEQAVEADRRAAIGGQVRFMSYLLLSVFCAVGSQDPPVASRPAIGTAQQDLGSGIARFKSSRIVAFSRRLARKQMPMSSDMNAHNLR